VSAKFKIELDEGLCVGHGRCYALAPDIFDEDDRGHCVLRHSEISAEQEQAAALGVHNCPEEALTLRKLG
jgi:ferredoxin